MRELSFMGPSNDGKRLLLVAEDGTQFELPVDSRLISVVSREHGTTSATRTTPKPNAMPTPREIQDQVRHGAAVEDIAAAAGVSAEDVSKFAYPVITERAHVADQAREARVRVGSEHITLEDAVLDRVKPRAVDPRLIRWDAWRIEGTTWTVVVAYPAAQGDRTATFSFNSSDKSISANDDEARWLLEIGETPTPAAAVSGSTEPERPRPHVVPASPNRPVAQADPEHSPESPQESDSAPQARSWDRAHPAAKAHERREANGDSRTSSQEEAPPSTPRVNPEHPAASSTTPAGTSAPNAEPKPTTIANDAPSEDSREAAPQWEELLFGSPQNEDPS